MSVAPTWDQIPDEDEEVPPVPRVVPPKKPKGVSASHTVAVSDKLYQALLHEKHQVEIRERRLVSFNEVLKDLIISTRKYRKLVDETTPDSEAEDAE